MNSCSSEMASRLFPLSPYRARVDYRINGVRRHLAIPVDPPSEGEEVVERTNDDLGVALHFVHESEGLRVEPRVMAVRPNVALDRVEPLIVEDYSRARLRFFRQGWQSWSGTSSLPHDIAEPRPKGRWLGEITRHSAAPNDVAVGHFNSELCSAVADLDSRRAVALGYLTCGSQFGAFEIFAEDPEMARIVARIPFEGAELEPNQPRAAEVLWLQWGQDPTDLLEHYALRVAKRMSARAGRSQGVGWCSSRAFFSLREAPLDRSMDQAAAAEDDVTISHFTVGQGYQAAIGDWLRTHPELPVSLADLSERIQKHGLAPGVWLAPFIARPEASVLHDRPEWFIKSRQGRPRRAVYNPAWGKLDTAKALDMTHPGAQQWLARAIRTLTAEWGYRLLRLDFLFAAALPGRRHDPTATGAQALRRGLEVIRDAAGDEVLLVASGCPLGPAVGLVDLFRTGPDVSPVWNDWLARSLGGDYELFPSTRNAVRNALTRAFMHGQLWLNDPDCVLVREQGGNCLNVEEAQTLATVAALGSRGMTLSCELGTVAPNRMEIVRKALMVQNTLDPNATPRCLDLFERDFPRLLWAPRSDGGSYLAALNPEEEAQELSVELQNYPVLGRCLRDGDELSDIWSRQRYVVRSGRLELGLVSKHAARLLPLGLRAERPA